MYTTLKKAFFDQLPSVDFASIRYENHNRQELMLRSGELLPTTRQQDVGVMITIFNKGGSGYAATSDLSPAGINEAIERAMHWASLARDKYVLDFSELDMPSEQSKYQSPVQTSWDSVSLPDKISMLQKLNSAMTGSDIVDTQVGLWHHNIQKHMWTTNGGDQAAQYELLLPQMTVTVAQGSESQSRSFGGHAYTQQGGLERLETLGFSQDAARRIVEEARELLVAPNCPNDTMDLLVAPDQMVLQIHESIGHPLELDRILGDERNYAGTSFVTLDMFGSYQYGSKLLNITYDPTVTHQVASYPVDDDGLKAERTYIIKEGILKRPLGGGISQQRAKISGVANSRSTHWSRPPIDRMANLNLENGTSSFDDLLGQIERGVYVQTNCSWSIDDSRNKFQFGCERAQLIENGKLTTVVKNPGYRGISASFWRSLKGVGNKSTNEVMGTPYCGKGEPNQAIHVGHASPVCLFENVQVFGGGE